MKTPNYYHPLIAATLIAAGGIIPMSFGDEITFIPTQAVAQVETDPVKKLIHAEVIQPLGHLAQLRGRFSRMGPTHSTSYQLVETTPKGAQPERTFTVNQKVTPLRIKGITAESKFSEFLKLRKLANSDQLQVDLKGKWVSLSEHPILRSLPKPKPEGKIIP